MNDKRHTGEVDAELETYFEKYPDVPKETILKQHMLSLGHWFSDAALDAAAGALVKSYRLFSYDLVPMSEFKRGEHRRVGFEEALRRLAGQDGATEVRAVAFDDASEIEEDGGAVRERGACRDLVAHQMEAASAAGAKHEDARHQALVQVCHVLFNTSEFLYVE